MSKFEREHRNMWILPIYMKHSGIKFKHGLIENAMFCGVQWIDHDQIGLSAYGRDYVISEKIG